MTTLVDLTRLPLADIAESRDGFTIGAMATLTEMLDHPGLAAHLGGVFPEMLVHVGSPLLRNQATLGGHLARGRLSDVIPVLTAADASIRWFDGEEREAPLTDYYESGTHRTPMLVTEVFLPRMEGAAAAFYKVLRTYFDLALINSACTLRVSGGAIDLARVAVGETPAVGARVPNAEAVLLGAVPGPEAFAEAGRLAVAAVPTGDDSRASAEYRSHLVGVAVQRCLAAAAQRLEVGS
jgi:CO/xanthine dehydrogenase FAD-binding subunit